MGTIQTSKGAIGVEQRGAEHGGRPILFLHGVGSDKSVWRPQLDHFGQRQWAIAIDYPGYGESDPLPDATRDDFAAAAWAVLDQLGASQAIICGLSLGGVVALAMHHAHPDRCAALILADSFAVHPEGEAIYARAVEGSRSMPMRGLAEARAPLLLGAAASEALRREIIDTMAAIDPDAYRLGAAAVWLADQRDRAAEVRAPTLVICGEEDKVTPPILSLGLAGFVGAAGVETIIGAGHLSNIEQPEDFNAAVDRFLETLA